MSHFSSIVRWAGGALAVAAGAVALVGCKVDQEGDVKTYRDVLRATPMTAPARPLAANEPVSLRRALILANNHNESLSISGETYLQALINKRRLVASIFTPTVSGSAGVGATGTGQRSNTFAFGGGTNQSLQLGLTEQVNLFNGFRDVAAIDQAEYVSRQRRWQLLDLQNSILLDVANTYYNTLIAESSVDVLRDTVSLKNQLIANQTAQFKTGIAKRLDVLQSEADAAATRASLTQAINNVQNGRAALAQLVGVPSVEGPMADDLPETPPEYDLDVLVQEAMATRQDLQAAREAIEAANQGVKIAVGGYYPTLGLNLTENLYRDPASATNWAASLPFSIPIFTAGAVHEDVRAAWSQFRQSALTETQTQRQVLQDVRTAYANLQSAAAQLRDLRYGVDAAQNAYNVATQSYVVGSAKNLDVLTAQNVLLNARLNLVTEQLSYKLFFLQLLRSQGRLSIGALPTTRPTSQPATRPTTFPLAH